MAVRQTDELLRAVGEALPDATNDSAIELMTDIRDTIAAGGNVAEVEERHKKEMEENEKKWREKFRETFYAPVAVPQERPTAKKTKFDDLFMEE